MNQREAKLANAATAIRSAAREQDMNWPQSVIDNPMTPPMRAELFAIQRRDIAALNLGAAIVEAMLLDADGFAVLIELRQKKKWAFDGCVVLARQQLAAKDDAPTQEQAA